MPDQNQHSEETRAAWERHYARDKSRQSYPDENLVRMLAPLPRGAALDYGCGSGRHLKLLHELGFTPLYGTDTSQNSLELSRAQTGDAAEYFLSEGIALPLGDASLDVIVCWGVLHYNQAEQTRAMLREMRRVLKADGVLLGTLRAEGDTHFSGNQDINQAYMKLYSENEARALLTEHFATVELGFASRSPVGELERRLCHWLFRARGPV